MTVRRRIKLSEEGGVVVAKLVDRKIEDIPIIEGLRDELFDLVDKDGKTSIIVDCSGVEFFSSAALNVLIILDKKIGSGKIVLCGPIDSDIAEVFHITRLDQLFEIRDNVKDALSAF